MLDSYSAPSNWLVYSFSSKSDEIYTLQAGVAFLYPLKTPEKPLGFLMFPAGIGKQHRTVMG